MERYQVILAYEGTHFEGFQRQEHKHRKVRTVQGAIEDVLRQLGWSGNTIMFAGRTDTGVHASGQVIGFDLAWTHSTRDLRNALNARLPDDIAVTEVNIATADFHPRFDAIARRYRYRIYFQEVRDPMREQYAWRVWPPLLLEPLVDIARILIGEHDFSAFGTALSRAGSTRRKIFQAEWGFVGEELIFEISANAFLYHMVRRLVYVQVMVAKNKFDKLAILDNLSGEQKNIMQGMAPAHGLELIKVIYK